MALERGAPFEARPDFAEHWCERPGDAWGFRQAYAWMASIMRERVGAPPDGCLHPVWAWAKAPACGRSGAPDLRSMRDSSSTALIELSVDPAEVLLSDHGSWHMVLNGAPFSLSEEDSDLADGRIALLRAAAGRPAPPGPRLSAEDYADPAILGELSTGWRRIFEVGPVVHGQPVSMAFTAPFDPDWVCGSDVAVQACLWRIEPRHLVSWRAIEPKPAPTSRRPR